MSAPTTQPHIQYTNYPKVEGTDASTLDVPDQVVSAPVAAPKKSLSLWGWFYAIGLIAGVLTLWVSSMANDYKHNVSDAAAYDAGPRLTIDGEPAYLTCQSGKVKDGRGTCVLEADYEVALALSNKSFKAWMKNGEIDFRRWVEKKGLKPALASSTETITLSYLCSAKPTQDGRFYAANSLGVKDSIDYFFSNGAVRIKVGWNSATEVAQDWCPKVPSWAKPSPPSLAPKSPTPPSLAPKPSAPPQDGNVGPAPDEADYGG